ncbi:glycosyl hydrolase family 95 catalytic domain-containing protein, partial [Escherichia coli]|uniref:glycosyl hydrolase family 95 catalytic domain-containing protein n=1 Tax=Escherichia coli TaxID=562 RepID=UPI003EBB4067
MSPAGRRARPRARWGGNGWQPNTVASAWYAHHVYEHWAFTRDDEWLRTRGL